MITENDIYWLTRMDHIHSALEFAIGACIIGLALGGFMWAIGHDSATPRAVGKWGGRICTIGMLIMVLCGAGKVFAPTTREMAAIKVIPLIANNQELQGLGTDIVDLAREWVKELKPKAKTLPAEAAEKSK